MKKYQWFVHSAKIGTHETTSFTKALKMVDELSGRRYTSLTHRRFLRRSNNKIYYPDGYVVERVVLQAVQS